MIKNIFLCMIFVFVIFVPLGIKYQIDIYHGYCAKEGRFLTNQEILEQVVRNIIRPRDQNHYLNNLSNCCIYKSPVDHWGGEAKDYAFRYRMLGVYHGQVSIMMKDGGGKFFYVTNCGKPVDPVFLETGTYFE